MKEYQHFDKIQFLKNFSITFLEEVSNHTELIDLGNNSAYFMVDIVDIVDTMQECLQEYEEEIKKENK